MFENYPINFKNLQEEALADFTQDFFWVKKPENILRNLPDEVLLLEYPPEPHAQSLCRKLADLHQLPEQTILIYNGIQDALFYITQLLQNTSCKIVLPAAPHFEEVAKYFRLKTEFGETTHNYGSFRGFKAAFLSNPSFPFGHILYPDELEDLCREYPETIFVLDESYMDFCTYASSVLSLVKKISNLLIIKPLSERCGLPGLNLCYVATSKRIAEALQKNTPIRHINTLSLEIGKYLVDHIQENPLDMTQIQRVYSEFVQKLSQIDILTVSKSYCHYFVVEIQEIQSKALKKHLWENHQMLIDDLSGFKGLNERQFRLSTLSTDKNNFLVEILNAKSFLKKE